MSHPSHNLEQSKKIRVIVLTEEQELGEEAGHLSLDGGGGVELHLRALAQFLQYVH
jgi:hypothetical protein